MVVNPTFPSGLIAMRGSKSGTVLLVHLLGSVAALSSPSSSVEPNPAALATRGCQPRRSVVLAGLGGCLTAAQSLSPSASLRETPLTFIPKSAWAMQERNEALCGTGFFTNFMEYRCTELGDISDEGLPGALSDSQSERADALLSKFQLDDKVTAGDAGATSATGEAQAGAGVEPSPTGTSRPRRQPQR